MTKNLLEIVTSIVKTFSNFATTLSTPIDELLEIDLFGADVTVLSAMFGVGLTIFLTYTLVKWVIPT